MVMFLALVMGGGVFTRPLFCCTAHSSLSSIDDVDIHTQYQHSVDRFFQRREEKNSATIRAAPPTGANRHQLQSGGNRPDGA